jgi:polyhydroxyalkanoate synthesis regulator phasin
VRSFSETDQITQSRAYQVTLPMGTGTTSQAEKDAIRRRIDELEEKLFRLEDEASYAGC